MLGAIRQVATCGFSEPRFRRLARPILREGHIQSIPHLGGLHRSTPGKPRAWPPDPGTKLPRFRAAMVYATMPPSLLKAAGPCRKFCPLQKPLLFSQVDWEFHRRRHPIGRAGCPYQKLDPDVGMVETTEVRYGSDPAFPQNWPCQWRIFAQRQMSAGTVVVIGVGPEHAAQMRLAENDQMVQTFPSDRSDQPLNVGVLPGRTGCAYQKFYPPRKPLDSLLNGWGYASPSAYE